MIDIASPDGLERDENVGDLTPALLDRGFTPDEVRKVLKLNFVRVLGSVLE